MSGGVGWEKSLNLIGEANQAVDFDGWAVGSRDGWVGITIDILKGAYFLFTLLARQIRDEKSSEVGSKWFFKI